MAITHKAIVKVFGALYSITGDGAPTTATVGVVGDIYLDVDAESATYGNSYLCTDVSGTTYTWALDNREDARIALAIQRVETDYLRIRGKAFDTDDDDATVYPVGASLVAAEMALYNLGIIEGRGEQSGSVADKSATYESKLAGYPVSIVGQIARYVGVV